MTTQDMQHLIHLNLTLLCKIQAWGMGFSDKLDQCLKSLTYEERPTLHNGYYILIVRHDALIDKWCCRPTSVVCLGHPQ
jgi:hypothetical protein